MFQQTPLARITKPMTDLVIINAETTGIVLQRQNAFVAEVISSSVDQVKVLTEVSSLRDAIDSQRTYIQEISEKLQTTARDNVETIREASMDAGKVVRGVFRHVEDEVEDVVAEAQQSAAEEIRDAASAVAPATDVATAPQS